VKPIFHFDGYTVRPVEERDRPYLEALIQGDPYHHDRMTADYFLKLQPGEDGWALEDSSGQVVFYFRTSVAARIAIQFQPVTGPADRQRNAAALSRGLRWLESRLRANYFRQILFDTDGPELREFALQRLGFVEEPLLCRTIPSSNEASPTPPEAVGTVPTGRQVRG
jgi:hypothetical protein